MPMKESYLAKKFRKIFYKFKSRDIWHMRHYSIKFRILWNHESSQPVGYDKVSYGVKGSIETSSIWLKPELSDNEITILASGPSLRNVDLHDLENTNIIFLNGALRIAQGICNQKSLFHLVADPNFIVNNLDLYSETYPENLKFVYSARAFYELLRERPDFIKKNEKNFQIFDLISEPFNKNRLKPDELVQIERPRFRYLKDQHLGFSLYPDLGFFGGRTVLFSALQISLFWGIKKINLYGVDMGGTVRFYDGHLGTRAPSYLDDDFDKKILPSLDLISQYCRSNGVKVLNHCRTSRIPESVFTKKE